MKNKIKLISLFIISFFLFISCGFKPILKDKNLQNLNLKQITYSGPNNLVFLLKNSLNLKENTNLEKGYYVIVNISENIISTNKNISGITIEENIVISINLIIKNYESKAILESDFSEAKIITITNNPSSDNEIKDIEKRNIIFALAKKLLFTIQTQNYLEN